MAFKINITELLAAKEALGVAYPILAPLVESILAGDFIGAINSFIAGGGDMSAVGQLISLGMKWGFVSYVKNNMPFKKSFNFFGIEIGV